MSAAAIGAAAAIAPLIIAVTVTAPSLPQRPPEQRMHPNHVFHTSAADTRWDAACCRRGERDKRVGR